ncbi:hypothetical protein [Tuberibacillus sp. Marseille-P3662]|uniref:hypothetical protein n=1 Tax=Tuberibacillus sp. Marseille-P3662 TaxID=1965358 RepID=UPI000A1CADB0|nr:hypothetical protein [Tuberibacillus sp. Marseille-P3662]
MFEMLFDLPMDLQIYLFLMSALLMISLQSAWSYFPGTYYFYAFYGTKPIDRAYIIKSLRYSVGLTLHQIVDWITRCAQRKDRSSDDDDDHCLLLIL